MENELLSFIRRKDYKDLGPLGRGGLGETRLIYDEIIKEHFVCKKYSPEYEDFKEKYFGNFIDEIKLLHLASHRNIVRVFNYYLYPDHSTGYILMEYIEGLSIDEYCKTNPENINLLFIQVIEGFRYLEGVKILHRDIRPANILVSNEGIVKVIDFGFGKKIDFPESGFSNSVMSINWRYTLPDEFENNIYDFATDIYFIGKMFEELITQNNISIFKYGELLKSMTAYYSIRINSFESIYRSILNSGYEELEFTLSQKSAYRNFANHLSGTIVSIRHNAEYQRDPEHILVRLTKFYATTILEVNVQLPGDLVGCFINGNYRFYPKYAFPVDILKDFIDHFKLLPALKKEVVINNLWNRFDAKRESQPSSDDLPF